MPITKFLGHAPQGLNATGEGDERNYYDMISSLQETTLRPALEKLYGVIKASAGIECGKGQLSFNPLRQMSEKDQADISKTKAETLDIHARSGVMPKEVQARAIRSAMDCVNEVWGGEREKFMVLGTRTIISRIGVLYKS